jgi:rubredoxin
MSETISESSGRDGQYEQPPVNDSVRCPGCETTRQWKRFDNPPEDVNAVGTCPACGTHILDFDMITEDNSEEWAKFRRSLTDFAESDDHANEENQ